MRDETQETSEQFPDASKPGYSIAGRHPDDFEAQAECAAFHARMIAGDQRLCRMEAAALDEAIRLAEDELAGLKRQRAAVDDKFRSLTYHDRRALSDWMQGLDLGRRKSLNVGSFTLERVDAKPKASIEVDDAVLMREFSDLVVYRLKSRTEAKQRLKIEGGVVVNTETGEQLEDAKVVISEAVTRVRMRDARGVRETIYDSSKTTDEAQEDETDEQHSSEQAGDA